MEYVHKLRSHPTCMIITRLDNFKNLSNKIRVSCIRQYFLFIVILRKHRNFELFRKFVSIFSVRKRYIKYCKFTYTFRTKKI